MRYLAEPILRDLAKKMVILAGPRQCGKTTLAKELCGKAGTYLNWDIRRDQKVIREQFWEKSKSLIVLDELHKYPQWKNYLKGLADEFGNKPPLLITGSARLDTFRRQGDALTGRSYHYHLHPVDLEESAAFLPKASNAARCSRLLETGGFPEALLNPDDAERLRNDRFDIVLREDLHDLSKSNSLRNIQILIEILRERTGQLINYSNIARDLSVAPATVKNWIDLLERLYLIFTIIPYSRGYARSLKKEFKVYFYDCAAAYDPAQRLENLTACSLHKFCDWAHDVWGKKMELRFFRDREHREVDFVVLLNRQILAAVEIKTSDEKLSGHLRYFRERSEPIFSRQLVHQIHRRLEKDGIIIGSLPTELPALLADMRAKIKIRP